MIFSKALYYPTIDISVEDWLKPAYLFWDGIRTIVLESMAERLCILQRKNFLNQ